jgi:hypothetical protein
MALQQIFPIVLVNRLFGPIAKKWPAGSPSIRFILDDALFTDPTTSVSIVMQCSWDGKSTWPYTDGPNTWQGGAKDRSGGSPSVTLGPFKFNEQIINPTHVRFTMEPGPGSDPVQVGLIADVSDDV